jgi:hypothetical protein
VHAIDGEQHELDEEHEPGDERRGLRKVGDRRMAGQRADGADPDGVAEEPDDHQAESQVLQTLLAREEGEQRHQRAGPIKRERRVKREIGIHHELNFLQR